MDLEYINLILASIALLSSFIGHLRHSRCCYGLIDVDMRTSTPITPSLTTPLIEPSKPIDIPKKEIKKNYL